jgi:hypothetical protein
MDARPVPQGYAAQSGETMQVQARGGRLSRRSSARRTADALPTHRPDEASRRLRGSQASRRRQSIVNHLMVLRRTGSSAEATHLAARPLPRIMSALICAPVSEALPLATSTDCIQSDHPLGERMCTSLMRHARPGQTVRRGQTIGPPVPVPNQRKQSIDPLVHGHAKVHAGGRMKVSADGHGGESLVVRSKSPLSAELIA